jgi:hypothetical protein
MISPSNAANQVEAVDDDLAQILSQMSPGQRIQLAADANDAARAMVAAGIRYQHPEWTHARISEEVARRMLSATD